MNKLNSLTLRIFAIFWLTLALVLMSVLLLPALDYRQLTPLSPKEIRHSNIIKSELEKIFYNQPKDEHAMLWKRALVKAIIPGQRLIVVNPEGQIFGAPHHEIAAVRNFISLSDDPKNPKKKTYAQMEIIGPFSIDDGEATYMIYSIRRGHSPQLGFINLLFDHPLFLLFFTMLISTPLLLWLAWSLAKPARKLKAAADIVAKGDLRIHPELESGPSEFYATGVSFNQMINELALMVTAQQRLISDISHELRTPLTRLQLATALVRRKQGSSAELERIENEALRLENMIDNLLKLSRNQYKNQQEHQVLFADELWCDMLESASFEAEHMGKSLHIATRPERWRLLGHSESLDSALENIIRNALRYSNQQIIISFLADSHGITIIVEDDGPGVSANERELIFAPFYRTDEARDRSSGGAGLGLAIVNSVVAQHNGQVYAEKSDYGGLRVVLWLPRYHD